MKRTHYKLLKIIGLLLLYNLMSSCKKEEQAPDAFTLFWEETKAELDVIPADSDVIGIKNFDNKTIQLIKIKSYGGIYFYAWVSKPTNKGKYKSKIKFSGFGRGNTNWNLFPHDDFMMEENTINVKVDIRGQGLSTEQIGFDGFLSRGNESKETYIYRGAFMDAVRIVDFIANHPQSNGKILTIGSSQGGLLSIVAAALSGKVDVCIANFPFFSNTRDYKKTHWPLNVIKKGISERKALEIIAYYDAVSFAKMIRIPYFSHCANEDDITPLKSVVAVFNNINTVDKELYIAICQGHGCSSSDALSIQKQESFINDYFNGN